jgi:hypothetical protein
MRGPSQHHHRISEVDVRPFQSDVIVDLLGHIEGLTNVA